MPTKNVMLLVATAIILTGCLGSNNTTNSFARTARLNCDNQGLEFGTQKHRACMRKQWENKRHVFAYMCTCLHVYMCTCVNVYFDTCAFVYI